MPRTRWQPCPEPTCPHLRERGGDCPAGHAKAKKDSQLAKLRATTDASRPSARQRGYGRDHERLFRAPVLRRDPVCVICGSAPSAHADHWPLTRKQLVERGLNPNDPRHGRGTCARCHGRSTARNDGGFGRPVTPTE